jgi:flavin reductase (DIM6/NTAB) family NADH-FMN oxidoreductase RutF
MSKVELSPRTLMFPLPAVLVSCQANDDKPNIITISWIGIVNSEPPMLSISVRKNRHSYEIIKKSGEFVVNLTFENNLRDVDFCGTKSGRNYDKFSELNLTPVPSKLISVPLIKECPINHECRVRKSIFLGTHEMFIAEIVKTHIDEKYLNERGAPSGEKINPLTYCAGLGEYRGGMKVMQIPSDKKK